MKSTSREFLIGGAASFKEFLIVGNSQVLRCTECAHDSYTKQQHVLSKLHACNYIHNDMNFHKFYRSLSVIYFYLSNPLISIHSTTKYYQTAFCHTTLKDHMIHLLRYFIFLPCFRRLFQFFFHLTCIFVLFLEETLF